MQTIHIDIDDYVLNSPIASQIISDFSTNKLILKNTTGIGGTSSVLAVKDQTIIIVSPLTGMIVDKENKKESHQLFIYLHSSDKWSDVAAKLHSNQPFILNTTPEQILELEKRDFNLFSQIRKQKILIDESHIAAEAAYRDKLADFMHLVYTQWENKFILSTATPVFQNLDIPQHILSNLDIYSFRSKRAKNKHLVIQNSKNYQNWIISQVKMGRKVVFFSNDIKVIKNILAIEDISVQTLLGDILTTKSTTIRKYTSEELQNMDNSIIEKDKDVLILSTKYLTGFDVEYDASIGIMANYNFKNRTDNRTINDIVQAYGRVRANVLDAALFYSNTNFSDTTNHMTYVAQFKAELEQAGAEANHVAILSRYLPQIEENRTYSDVQTLQNNLLGYGFQTSIEEEYKGLELSGLTLSDNIQFVAALDPAHAKYHTDKVFNQIAGDDIDYNGFSIKYLAIFACGYILNVTESQYLSNIVTNTNHYDRMIYAFKTWIDTNLDAHPQSHNEFDKLIKFKVAQSNITQAKEAGAVCSNFTIFNQYNQTFKNAIKVINTLYLVYKFRNDELLDNEDMQKLEINSNLTNDIRHKFVNHFAKQMNKTPNQIIELIEKDDMTLNLLAFTTKYSTIFNKVIRDVTNKLEFEVDKEHIELIASRLISTISKPETDITKYSIKRRYNLIDLSIDNQKNIYKNYVLGLLSLDIAGHMFGFKRTKKDDREYNVATKVPRFLRYKYTPYQMIQIDIKSANAQIVDNIINTNIAMDVYDNISKNHNVNRSEAKVIYNSTLNNYKLPKSKAIEVYKSAGYPLQKAKELADLTCGNKIYYLMTANEKKIMDIYKQVARLQAPIRVHDAYLVYNTNYHHNLPTVVNNIKFDVKSF